MHERTAMAHRRSSGEVRPYVRSSKPRFNWTGDLKQLFEDAMTVLGGTRKATPKQIRELLKCPHIQLSHIKSRLQMCRIRMEEKERRSEVQGSQSREATADNVDPNGDEESVVVDENEANESAPLLSRPCCCLEYQSKNQSHQPPLKRARVEVQQASASSFQSNQYYFDYFGPTEECSAVIVPQFSAAVDFFREEQSHIPKKVQENNDKESMKGEEQEEGDELQLSLTLSLPVRANKINLDLSLSFP
ncbi:putative Myb family transcription factor At1g14600 [Phalaenopsis equestris]|uniref:putative Myb family transcription factor At1g14600 n=1 Tax=Phalaenopsis equestris TaxID=78828 RepID=UPI0009E3E35E|nr:putative Myb family transcription factor At1g14600 [Phalaenopsis equestris]